MSREEVLAYLAQHQVMTLATQGSDGIWAAAVFYVNRLFDLTFLSASHTRHGRHLATNPRVAATIQEDYADWRKIQGIQLEGTVRKLAGAERETAIALYKEKFPFISDAAPAVATALARVEWYCLTAERLFFIDNRKGFGHREQVL